MIPCCTGRNWRTHPPESAAEGLDYIFDVHSRAIAFIRVAYGVPVRLERPAPNLILHLWPDGTRDLYVCSARYSH